MAVHLDLHAHTAGLRAGATSDVVIGRLQVATCYKHQGSAGNPKNRERHLERMETENIVTKHPRTDTGTITLLAKQTRAHRKQRRHRTLLWYANQPITTLEVGGDASLTVDARAIGHTVTDTMLFVRGKQRASIEIDAVGNESGLSVGLGGTSRLVLRLRSLTTHMSSLYAQVRQKATLRIETDEDGAPPRMLHLSLARTATLEGSHQAIRRLVELHADLRPRMRHFRYNPETRRYDMVRREEVDVPVPPAPPALPSPRASGRSRRRKRSRREMEQAEKDGSPAQEVPHRAAKRAKTHVSETGSSGSGLWTILPWPFSS